MRSCSHASSQGGSPADLHDAVQIQASAGAADLGPLTATARRLVRHQVVLAYVMTTIITTLGVSAVITAVA